MDQVTQIPDTQLDAYAERLKGAVVLITGGGNGIRRETAVRCAKYGAKIVIGDLDVSGMNLTQKLISESGGECLTMRCDVMSWEDQANLFSTALDKFGTIDVVIANAGVAERFGLGKLQFDASGKPVRPDILTTEVNVVGVMYTTHLAVHYLRETHTAGSLKSLIYLASMAGIVTLGGAPQYTASKHAVLGLMRALAWPNAKMGLKIAAVTPWFVDTGIIPDATKILLSGLTYVPLDRAAGAILYAATEPDAEMTGGCVYAMMDGVTSLTRFPRDATVAGVFAELNARLDTVFGLQAMHKWAPRLMRSVGACVLLVVAIWFAWAKLV